VSRPSRLPALSSWVPGTADRPSRTSRCAEHDRGLQRCPRSARLPATVGGCPLWCQARRGHRRERCSEHHGRRPTSALVPGTSRPSPTLRRQTRRGRPPRQGPSQLAAPASAVRRESPPRTEPSRAFRPVVRSRRPRAGNRADGPEPTLPPEVEARARYGRRRRPASTGGACGGVVAPRCRRPPGGGRRLRGRVTASGRATPAR